MELKLRKFQAGGPMGAPEEAPVEEAPMGAPEGGAPAPGPEGQGGDPLMEIAQIAVQALQNQDCEAAMAVCQAFVQLIQQSQGGEPQGEPVYRAGGKLIARI